MNLLHLSALSVAGVGAALALAGCSGAEGGDLSLEGSISIDGSSTVFPITEAVAEEFKKAYPRVKVKVGVSGTGGGFKKYVLGETDISDASRPIKKREREAAKKNGVGYIEIPLAYDGLSVVVNKGNGFVDSMTVEELRRVFKSGSKVTRWSQVRAGWPDKPMKLFAPGTDSGTFDYFTEAVCGKSGAFRNDNLVTFSEDDNVLVRGIAGQKYALGFFGYAYYKENKGTLKIVPIDGGDGPVAPSAKTINNGTYAPLSRPLFIYINPKSAKRKEVATFVDFYLREVKNLLADVGYVPLPDEAYALVVKRWEARVTGAPYAETGGKGGLLAVYAETGK